MTTYAIAWYTHVTCAVLSISFFVVRGAWMFTGNSLLEHKLVKILPHVIDTILLAAAVALTIIISQYPFVNTWLTVKLFALIAYIVLGVVALRRGKTMKVRAAAFVAAVLMFAFIVSVAWYHYPLGIFVLFAD